MNLNISGHHIEVTRQSAIMSLPNVDRHFDSAIDVSDCVRGEAVLRRPRRPHVRGKISTAEAIDADMRSRSTTGGMLDRQIVKHKEKVQDHRADGAKYQVPL